MAEKMIIYGIKSCPFEWRSWLKPLSSDRQWGIYPSYFWYNGFKNANIFLKNHSEFDKKVTNSGIFNPYYRCYLYNKKTCLGWTLIWYLWSGIFGIFNEGEQCLVSLTFTIDVTITTRRLMGWTIIQLKPFALREGSKLKWKLKKNLDKFGKRLDKFGNIFEYIDWDKEPGGLHVHSRCYITLSSKWSLQ